jgi:tRNA A-37 threonylcarbamoyl transferase component Bud32
MNLSGNLIGQKVGDYRLDSLLGEGGMGVVYRGVHETLGQIVAIKMLHPDLMADDKIKSRFVREAQALARLNHPNVVRLISFIQHQDTYAIVMEFIEGKTLDRILQDKGIIPAADAADFFVEVLAAMHYAHSLGIIHRDIKPSNICVLDGTGIVKVLDFGTAKMVGAQRLTQEGMTLGTLVYMSPEQIVGRELDHRSDCYSLGVTLYELVTGKLPHDDADEMALVKAIARGVPQPPSVHYKHLPKRLEQIIMKAIEKDPAKRYQTAEDFLKDLKEYQNEERIKAKKITPASGQRAITPDAAFAPLTAPGGAAESTSPVPPPAAAMPLPAAVAPGKKRNPFYVAALAFVVLGAIGAGVAALSPTGNLQPIVLVAIAFGGGVALAIICGILGVVYSLGSAKAAAPQPAPAVQPPPLPPPPRMPAGPVAVSGAAADPLQGTLHVAPKPERVTPAGGHSASPGYAMPQQAAPAAVAPPIAAHATPAYLYALDGADKGRSWAVPHGAITIGRGPHNTITLNDPGVSTSHAQIGFDGTAFVLVDLQSRNGCYVNNQRVRRQQLNDRDIIVLGTTQLGFALTPGT